MRMMFGSEHVVEVESIFGLDNNGTYYVEFVCTNGDPIGF